MTFSCLPFEVLGQVGPLLAWVEGDHGSRLPATWSTESIPFAERERSWLLRELPTYSYDNVDEIVSGTRAFHHGLKPTTLPMLEERRWPSLSPPATYDLYQAFHHLNRYFFIWNGTEPCVREGRMEELHELGIRVPAGHLVRHGHARAVAEGVFNFDDALDLPELVTLLPSNSFGLRSIVRKGLSESHLHLRAVTSAEETWADNLLRPLSAHGIRGHSPAERRLLVLNLFAGRLLALAVWMSLLEIDRKLPIEPARLLRLLDRVYFARTAHEEHVATEKLEKAIRLAVYGPPETVNLAGRQTHQSGEHARESIALINAKVPEQYQFLLRWMAPTGFRLQTLKRRDALPSSFSEGPRDRYRFVHQLHLAAHLRLVQLTSRESFKETVKQVSQDRILARKRIKSYPPEQPIPHDARRDFLHQALFRYLVCRTHHWQMSTQQGRTTGLRHFSEFFRAKQRRPSGLSEVQYAELVFDRLRQWRGLRVLEGRVAPPKKVQELVPWILAHARSEDRRIQKFGLVVHFKKEDEQREEKSFSNLIQRPVPHVRWGRRRRLVREEGLRLYQLLKQPTPITPFVVGIDACNLELATPPEVFAPVFRFLRHLPIPLSGSRQRYSPYFDLETDIRKLVENRRLGMTYHVGEDFRHLLSGLRAIGEVVDFLSPGPGDRLGHGTALALQPKDWLEHNGYQAVVPKLEWLDTLVWVHHFLGPGDDLVGELGLEDRIQRLSGEIYNRAVAAKVDPLLLENLSESHKETRSYKEAQPYKTKRGMLDWDWPPLTLWDAWRLRQLDPYSLDLSKLLTGELVMRPQQRYSEEWRRWHEIQTQLMQSVRQEVGSRNAYLLLALYWISPVVRREGDKVIVVDMQDQRKQWLELCHHVEEKMKLLIEEKELVVEVNPSSNRIIGPMDRYSQHHVFNLTLDENRRLARRVRVSVNTDNPAVCHTTLAHEHYLLGEILMRDVPEAEVVHWLEWLRKNGEDYNFVRRLKTPEEDPAMDRLLKWLRSIRPTVLESSTRGKKYDAFWLWLRESRLRSFGFAHLAIATDPGALERVVALEQQICDLRKCGAEQATLNERLSRLEGKLSQIKRHLKSEAKTPH